MIWLECDVPGHVHLQDFAGQQLGVSAAIPTSVVSRILVLTEHVIVDEAPVVAAVFSARVPVFLKSGLGFNSDELF